MSNERVWKVAISTCKELCRIKKHGLESDFATLRPWAKRGVMKIGKDDTVGNIPNRSIEKLIFCKIRLKVVNILKVEKLLKEQHEIYEKRTPKSKEIHSVAKGYLPGGDTRSITFFKPYPLFTKEAKGFRIYDVDGNVYIDFLNNYTALVHGHAYPKIVEAVKEQLEKGWLCATGIESQYKLAKILCERFPSVEKVRFCNSGTEGTMMAIRAARAFTGRDKILKMEGGYHGSHLSLDISIHPEVDKAGPADKPLSIPESLGIPKSIVNDTIVAPFNNKVATEKIIKENKNELAAVIVEPMMGVAGMIPPKDDYLKFLREITMQYDILLIFDEIMTARLSVGGGQELFKVTPDLSCFGKMVGGYFPIGAFGGRKDVMNLFSPEMEGFIPHSGTFNGNAITMVAGIACMESLTPSAIEKINSLGNQLKKDIEKIFKEENIIGQVTGTGSLYNIHLTPIEVVDYRSAETSSKEVKVLLHMALINKGIFIAKRAMFNMSTVMTKKEVDAFINALRECTPILKAASS